jgi:NADH:ubiquinone oxidoreductase subunit 3 (subunit A)
MKVITESYIDIYIVILILAICLTPINIISYLSLLPSAKHNKANTKFYISNYQPCNKKNLEIPKGNQKP